MTASQLSAFRAAVAADRAARDRTAVPGRDDAYLAAMRAVRAAFGIPADHHDWPPAAWDAWTRMHGAIVRTAEGMR